MSYTGAVLGNSPVAFWHLQEDSPQTSDPLDDAGPNALDGAAGAILTTDDNTGPLIGVADRSMDFDGAAQYADFLSNALIDDLFDSGGTVEFWLRPGTGVGTVLSKISSTSSLGWEVAISSAAGGLAQIEFRMYFDGAGDGVWQTVQSPTQAFWHHVVVSYNSGGVANDPLVFVDGVSVPVDEVETPVGTRTTDAAQNLYVARRFAGDNWYAGRISYVSVYGSMLDTVRVWNDYSSARPGWANPLFAIVEPVLYLPFSASSGDEVDGTGSGDVFSVVGAPGRGIETPVKSWTALGTELLDGEAFVKSQAAAYRSADASGTVCAWVRPKTAAINRIDYVFEYGNADGTEHVRVVLESDGTDQQRRLHLSIDDASLTNDVQTGYILPADQWVFIAAASNGSSYDLWVNDTKIVSGTGTGEWFTDFSTTPDHVQVGRTGAGTYGDGMDIVGLSLFTPFLTDAEMGEIYRAGLLESFALGIVDGPEVHLPLDEPAGSAVCRNLSGASIGAPGSATSWNTVVNGSPTFRESGLPGGLSGIHLNGSDEDLVFEAQLSHLDFMFTAPMTFTIMFWAKLDNYLTSSIQYFLANADNTGEKGFKLLWNGVTDNRIDFYLFNGSGTIVSIIDGNSDISDNDWHHFTLRSDGSDVWLYIDGDEENTATFAGAATTGDANEDLRVGSNSSAANWLDGSIADVRIHDTDLGDNAAMKHFRATQLQFSAFASALSPFAHYSFTEATGTTVNDISGNDRDGTYVEGADFIDLTIDGLVPANPNDTNDAVSFEVESE